MIPNIFHDPIVQFILFLVLIAPIVFWVIILLIFAAAVGALIYFIGRPMLKRFLKERSNG